MQDLVAEIGHDVSEEAGIRIGRSPEHLSVNDLLLHKKKTRWHLQFTGMRGNQGVENA